MYFFESTGGPNNSRGLQKLITICLINFFFRFSVVKNQQQFKNKALILVLSYSTGEAGVPLEILRKYSKIISILHIL